MAIADMNIPGEEDRKTIAIVGDASISNGLAFEGINNVSNNPNNLLIILNDNDMSIDSPVGAMHRYLSDMTTSASYNRIRLRIYNLFKKWGLVNDKRKGLLLRFNNAVKSLISTQQNIFEGLNIRYFTFDGNDVTKVVKVLSDIKDMKASEDTASQNCKRERIQSLRKRILRHGMHQAISIPRQVRKSDLPPLPPPVAGGFRRNTCQAGGK